MATPTPQLINTIGTPQNQTAPDQQQKNQEQILQVWNLVKNSGNPEQAMAAVMNQNPEFKKAVETLSALGDPRKLFYERAKQKGVDPNIYINLLK
jgi:hypothetical protein